MKFLNTFGGGPAKSTSRNPGPKARNKAPGNQRPGFFSRAVNAVRGGVKGLLNGKAGRTAGDTLRAGIAGARKSFNAGTRVR